MASLDIFCSQTYLNFQFNLLKVTIRKEHEKIFCGPSNIFKNISWPINTCLKSFHDPCEDRPTSPPTNLMYGRLHRLVVFEK